MWIIAKIWISCWNINIRRGVSKSCWLTLYLPERNLSVPNHCLCESFSCCLPKDASTGLITGGRSYVSEKIPHSFSQQLKALSLNVHNITLLWMQLKGGFNLIHGPWCKSGAPPPKSVGPKNNSKRKVKTRCISKLAPSPEAEIKPLFSCYYTGPS